MTLLNRKFGKYCTRESPIFLDQKNLNQLLSTLGVSLPCCQRPPNAVEDTDALVLPGCLLCSRPLLPSATHQLRDPPPRTRPLIPMLITSLASRLN